jgi:hypothetical protein
MLITNRNRKILNKNLPPGYMVYDNGEEKIKQRK